MTVTGFGEKTAWVLSCVSVGAALSLPRRSPGLVPFAFPPAALFLQQCHFLRQAGHSEKAVSLFQAMVDFTFFKPDSVKGLPTKGQVRVPPEFPAPVSAPPSSGEGCG